MLPLRALQCFLLVTVHQSQCSIKSHSAFITYLTGKFSHPYVQSLPLLW